MQLPVALCGARQVSTVSPTNLCKPFIGRVLCVLSSAERDPQKRHRSVLAQPAMGHLCVTQEVRMWKRYPANWKQETDTNQHELRFPTLPDKLLDARAFVGALILRLPLVRPDGRREASRPLQLLVSALSGANKGWILPELHYGMHGEIRYAPCYN